MKFWWILGRPGGEGPTQPAAVKVGGPLETFLEGEGEGEEEGEGEQEGGGEGREGEGEVELGT